MEKQTIVLITLVIFQVSLVAIGIWAGRYTKNNDDFFLGGRGLGPTVAAISYAASASSAWMLIGFTGITFKLGLPAFWFVPCILMGHYISWTWLAPRLMAESKEKGALTVTDIIVGNITGPLRTAIVLAASLFVVVGFTLYVAGQFHASGTTFSSSFNISFSNSVFLGAGIILIYTLIGGFWAVSVTDTLQGLLMALVAIILPVTALIAVGGIGGLLAGLESTMAPSGASFTGGQSLSGFSLFFLGFASLAIGAIGQPQLLVRFMALRDTKALKRGRTIAMTWFTLVITSMFIVGLSGHVLLDNVSNPESVFFGLTNLLFPGIMAGIVTAAILSAIMSTADSQLLVAASVISHDLGLERKFGISPILISRLSITLLCLGAVWITLALPSDVFSRVAFAWTSLGSAFGPIIIIRALRYPTRPGAVLGAMVLGFCLTVYFHFYPQNPPDIFERFVPFVLALMIVFGFREKPAHPAESSR